MSLSLATAQLLGVHLTRWHPKKPDSIVDAIRKRLSFPKNPRSATISDGDDNDDDGNHIVWDEPNPFGPPDPTLAHLRALINAEIARTRQYESIGPFDPVDDDSDYYDDDSDEDYDDGDSDGDGHIADDEDNVSDHDDRVANVRGRDVDYDDRDDRVANVRDNEPSPILLPRLLSVPLRFIPSPSPSDMDLSTPWADDEDRVANVRSRDVDYDDHDVRDNDYEPAPILLPRLLSVPLRFIPSPPPPSPSPSDKDLSTPWADLAQVYNDIAEAHERDTRKAKRDAHRSRSKALAILGPEVSSAL